MTSRTGSAEDLGDFGKSQLASGEDGWLSLARLSQASGLVAVPHVLGLLGGGGQMEKLS